MSLKSLPSSGGCGLGTENTNVAPTTLKKVQMGEGIKRPERIWLR